MSGIHGKNAMMYLNGEWVPVTLEGVSWFQPILDAARARKDETRHRLDAAFGPTDPTLESLLRPDAR